MSKPKFSTFIRELEAEARAEGPDAERELKVFREHFQREREKNVVTSDRRAAGRRRRPRRG